MMKPMLLVFVLLSFTHQLEAAAPNIVVIMVDDFGYECITANGGESYQTPHIDALAASDVRFDPFQPTPESPDWDPTISSEAVQKDVKHFAEMTEFADQMVGNVIGKLDELGIRDNTLILFLGDNGTHRKITTQFKGEPYQGGKSTTTARGTHVPLIANWPSVIKAASVNPDLISSTDFLPTICEVAGVKILDQVDGVSFLPQLKSEPGKPREWLYMWYSPRQRQNLTVRECAFDLRFKLYRTGAFFDLQNDPFETQDLDGRPLSNEAEKAKRGLQAVLDQFQDARPESLDQKVRV